MPQMKTFQQHKVFSEIVRKAKDFRRLHGDKPDYGDLLIVVNRRTYDALLACIREPDLNPETLPLLESDDFLDIYCDWGGWMGIPDGEVHITIGKVH